MHRSVACGRSLMPFGRWPKSGLSYPHRKHPFRSPVRLEGLSKVVVSRACSGAHPAESKPGNPAVFTAIGSVGGGVGAVVGIGGGNVMMPLMLFFTPNITQHQLHATSLVAVASTGALGSASYLSVGAVDLTSALLIAASASATAPLGASLAQKMPAAQLKLLLAIFVLTCAPMVPLKGAIMSGREEQSADEPKTGSDMSFGSAVAVVGSGLLAGTASGLLGIGGGVVLTPVLALATDLPQQTVLGTSLAAMVVPSVIGALVHHRAGTIVWAAGVPLAIGAGLGAVVGSRFALQLPEAELKWTFAGVMGFIGLYLLRGALKMRK